MIAITRILTLKRYKKHPMNKAFRIKFYLTGLLWLTACQSSSPDSRDIPTEVVVWELNNPSGLNPLTANDAAALQVLQYTHQKLLQFDYGDYSLQPVLARSRPNITPQPDGSLHLQYQIRPEARWDDGTSITAADVLFTYKAALHPGVAASHLSPYLSDVTDLVTDAEDPQSFTIVCRQAHLRAEVNTGGELTILPAHVYDPDGLLQSYTLADIAAGNWQPDSGNAAVFAEQFSSITLSRDPAAISGSGPYRLQEWLPGQRLVMARKDAWWGDDVPGRPNHYFEAYPQYIVHEIISDQTAAITALKAGTLDVMRGIKARDYREDLMTNDRVTAAYQLMQPPQFSYSCFGINQRQPLFADSLTRQALAMLVPYDRLVSDVLFGFGERIAGPVLPFMKPWHNPAIQPYTTQPDSAAVLLAAAGWTDSDKDGILDRQINGGKQVFRFSFLLNGGNSEREKIALMYQDALAKAGIIMEIQPMEWSIYLEKLETFDFDMFYVVFSTDPALEDFSQLWKTTSASNFTGFGNPAIDSLIDAINTTLYDEQRKTLVHQFQEEIHREVPYIFLWTPQNRIAIHQRFTNLHISSYRAGYWVPGFQLQ